VPLVELAAAVEAPPELDDPDDPVARLPDCCAPDCGLDVCCGEGTVVVVVLGTVVVVVLGTVVVVVEGTVVVVVLEVVLVEVEVVSCSS
jgi:hypothetical protein